MPDPATLAIVRALARGLDPATGAALPQGDACQQPATVRALCAVLAELEAPPSGAPARRAAGGPAKAGQPWSDADDAALVQAFDAGAPLADLARRLERTRGAIEARLVRLGKIAPPPGLRLREPVGLASGAGATGA